MLSHQSDWSPKMWREKLRCSRVAMLLVLPMYDMYDWEGCSLCDRTSSIRQQQPKASSQLFSVHYLFIKLTNASLRFSFMARSSWRVASGGHPMEQWLMLGGIMPLFFFSSSFSKCQFAVRELESHIRGFISSDYSLTSSQTTRLRPDGAKYSGWIFNSPCVSQLFESYFSPSS